MGAVRSITDSGGVAGNMPSEPVSRRRPDMAMAAIAPRAAERVIGRRRCSSITCSCSSGRAFRVWVMIGLFLAGNAGVPWKRAGVTVMAGTDGQGSERMRPMMAVVERSGRWPSTCTSPPSERTSGASASISTV